MTTLWLCYWVSDYAAAHLPLKQQGKIFQPRGMQGVCLVPLFLLSFYLVLHVILSRRKLHMRRFYHESI
jgi:hypothetical protein